MIAKQRNLLLVLLQMVVCSGSVLGEPMGPIPISNQFPLQAVHLSLKPQTASVLRDGNVAATFLGAWTNTFIVADNYTVDAESVDGTLDLRRGFGDQFEAGVSLPVLWRGGGRLDSTIDRWHRFWSLPRGQREDSASDEYDIEGVTRDGWGVKVKDRGVAIGNLELSGKYSLTGEGEGNMAVVTAVSLPRFGQEYVHDGVDLLLGVLRSDDLGWTVFHWGGAAVLFTDRSYDSVPYAPLHLEGYGVSETAFADNFSLLVGLYGGTKTVEGISGYPECFIYLDVGGRLLLSPEYALVLNLRENPFPHDGTADISFVGGVEGRW